ncbi:MAG: hypothetical protein ACFB00_01115 [Parvularculaceae bacterium]
MFRTLRSAFFALLASACGGVAAPGEGDPRHNATALGFLGEIDPYQRAGTIEVYGALFHPVKNSPVGVADNVLTPLEPTMLLNWGGFDLHAPGARSLEISLACDTGQAPDFRTGFLLRDGAPVEFAKPGGDFAAGAELDVARLPNNAPDAMAAALGEREVISLNAADQCGRYVADLPSRLADALAASPVDSPVTDWYLQVEAVKGTVSISRLALIADRPRSVLSGRLTNPSVAGEVRMLDSAGGVRDVAVNADGGFEIEREVGPVSVYFEPAEPGARVYGARGRWLEPEGAIVIVNDGADRKPAAGAVVPDRKTQMPALLNRRNTLKSSGRYNPHTRFVFLGKEGEPQEWESRTFINQHGFFDRDRFAENPGDCRRVVLAGGSNVTTLMHRLTEKATFQLEAALGVGLGACVEVLSEGQGAGHLGSYAETVLDYAPQFEPDLVVFETIPYTLLSADPEIMRILEGWCPDHPKFTYLSPDEAGELTFTRRDPKYAQNKCPRGPEEPREIDGMHPYAASRLPLDQMGPTSRRAYDLLFDTLDFVDARLPETDVMLVSYAQLAQAMKSPRDLRRETTLPSGEKAETGLAIYADNLRKLCEDRRRACKIFDADQLTPETSAPVAWRHDNHHNLHGLQVFSDGLAERILDLYGDDWRSAH